MILQPPAYVPSASASAADTITHHCTSKPLWYPPTTSASVITPIVFCASCNPWPSAMADALSVCAIRNRRFSLPGCATRNSHMMPIITKYASVNPTSGDTIIGMTTFPRMPPHSTVPAAASVAPTSPPISACDEDDGRPSAQVITFHTIAPVTPASTTSRLAVTWGSSTMPDPTVCATPVPRNAPTRFIDAATSSAARGVRARVDTEVAIAFAASWKPLV